MPAVPTASYPGLIHEPDQFLNRLKKWRDDPESDPELEKWYQELSGR